MSRPFDRKELESLAAYVEGATGFTGHDLALVVASVVLREGLENIAYEMECLGLGGASTPMGAMEVLSLGLKEGLAEVSSSVERLAEATESSA